MKLSELKMLYEVLGTKTKVQVALESFKEDYVTLEDIENEDYFYYGSFIYSRNEYTTDYRGDLLAMDEAFYCEGMEEYVHEDDTVTVYEYRGDRTYSRRYVEQSSDYYEFRGEYYDGDALSCHDLVWVDDVGEVWRQDDAYYHEGDNEWRSYEDDSEDYVRGYHNGSYQSVNFDRKCKYRIGYEIEKEDRDVLESISIGDFEDATGDVWRKEKDGSLDDESGYELISPTFDLNIDKIFEHIESNEILVQHINADISSRCGGHIHLSERGLSGDQLFEKIKGYTPLFYALYYGRVDKTYCKGKNNDDLRESNEKYQAIKIHSDRVEFRIISAVPNVRTLKWRTKLLMMILQHPTSDIIRAYYNVDTKFTKLLKQTYNDEKLALLKDRFIENTRKFEGIDINKDKK